MYPRILGVFSHRPPRAGRSGDSRLTPERATYWYVRRISDEAFEIQALNRHHVPSGERRQVAFGEFAAAYFPEIGYYRKYTVPALTTLRAKIAKGEESFAKGELDLAEQEFLKAVMIDEQNAPANLGLGAVYCEKGELAKVRRVLDVLLGNDETFLEEQRHQFNRFGIALRKLGLCNEAVIYYRTALSVNKQDDHLHFNIARAYHQAKDLEAAAGHVARALELNPGFREAARFGNFLCKLGAGEDEDLEFIDGPDIRLGGAGPDSQ